MVLDRSGSMGGGPLEASRRALTALVGRLDPRDRFGLVVFDDHADVVVPTSSLQSLGVDKVKEAIAGIHSGGCTDLSVGYLLGLSEASRAKGDGGATVLLISDGHANSGETSPVVLGNLAEGRASKRITTTTVGYGLGYDEELLVALARGGNGDHVFAEDVDQLHPAIAEQVGGLLAKAVTAASVTIRPLGAGLAAITVLHDVPAARIGDEVIAQLGDLYQGESRRLLIQLDIPAMAALGLATVAEVAVRYTELPDLVEQVITLPVTVNVVPGDVAAGRVPNPVVTVERLIQQAQQSKRDAISSLRAGEADAEQLLAETGRYIRPILLVQVERTGREQRDAAFVHALDVVEYLQTLGLDEDEIAVKTASVDDLKDQTDLLSPVNRTRAIVTKQALQEGWDCPFAYVLCSLAPNRSASAMTQLVGRVLRQPHARSTSLATLNESYVFCHQAPTSAVVAAVKRSLEQDGMGDLVGRVASVGTAPGERKTPRRQEFEGRRIFLPRVLWVESGTARDLDFDQDILGAIDWSTADVDGIVGQIAPETHVQTGLPQMMGTRSPECGR